MKDSYSPRHGNLTVVDHKIPRESVITLPNEKHEPCRLSVADGSVLDTVQLDGSDQRTDSHQTLAETKSKSLDPWLLPELNEIDGQETKRWRELTPKERAWTICVCFLKAIVLLALLYFFIYSLDILSSSFRLLGGRTAGAVFRESRLLRNAVFGLMIGVLATVLVQSSSTSTSIVVSMVASEILDVRAAIPIIMGANIGTSLTSTLVSAAHSGNRAQLRRAFAGATVHDMFNWLTVVIVLPIEAAFGYLYHLSTAIVQTMNVNTNGTVRPPQLLAVLTKPLAGLTVQLDESLLEKLAIGEVNASESTSLVKRTCGGRQCRHIFASFDVSDTIVGVILLATSLAILIGCLICIVKLLSSVLRGRVIGIVHRTINAELPGRWGFLTGYLAIVVGALMTIVVQSSSVFTSALTPLVGLGVLSVERMYPLTLGSNVGTTFTSLLAALASPPRTMASALQISLCHLFFNLTGILLFYPIPCTRRIPITLAKLMGESTGQYRWFAVLYVLLAFFLLPASIFGLSLLGDAVLVSVGAPAIALLLIIILVNILQRKYPSILPGFMRTWAILPEWMHSLEPYDRLIASCLSMCPCRRGASITAQSTSLASSDSHRRLADSRAESPARFVASRSIVELSIATLDDKNEKY